MDQLLKLFSRSDDQAIKFEVTRVFVNIARSLSVPPHNQGEAYHHLHDERIIATLTWMLRIGAEYPVLVNEAIIALALVAIVPSGSSE